MNDRIPDSASILEWCRAYVAKILDVPLAQVDPSVEVDRLGLDSSTAVALIMSLEERLGIELMPEILFDHPTLGGLSKHLASRVAAERGA